MIKKLYTLDNSQVQVIECVKTEQGFTDSSKALRYIVDEYEKTIKKKNQEDEFIEKLLDAYNKKYYALFERLRWASQTSEKNSTMLLDAVNTILLIQDITDGILVDAIQAPVLQMSQTAYKEKIAYFKQMKDDRKRKNEEKSNQKT